MSIFASSFLSIRESRRQFLRSLSMRAGALALATSGISPHVSFGNDDTSPIKVGILHSLSGTMATSGQSLVDGIQMAIDEVNQQGGVLGRKLQGVIEDGESDPKVYSTKAEKLILEDHVQTIFGCWTSASRKAVLPIVEREQQLLWYPVQYEGYEQSPSIMYGGAAPNQQILPALQWGLRQFGTRVFLVGSDYVFPRIANRLIKAKLSEYDGVLSGEEYQPLGRQNFEQTIKAIKRSKPNFIVNTINGDSNRGFFEHLARTHITSKDIPVISMSIAEDELQRIGLQYTSGHYAAWNYFESIDSPSNQRFVSNFKMRYGQDRVTDDPIESAYTQVHLYALAVRKAKTTHPQSLRQIAGGIVFGAPQGLIRIDPHNQHTWKVTRIGQIQDTGQFSVVWSSQEPIHPDPYPVTL